MIQVQNLYKAFGNIIALDGISFEISRGETFGLLGPNGAGKTTTINILCGLLSPDNGTVTLDGQLDPSQAQTRLSLGVVPQALALYDDLTAIENLFFFGRMYSLSGSLLKEQVQKNLALTGLDDRSRDRVSTYSGGMKRRLNLACSLLHNPPILFFDEPTVGVDPQSRNLLFETFNNLKKEGRTILYTTHYMEEAQRLCDRVAILDHGKLMDVDTVENLIQKHGGHSRIEVELEHIPPDPKTLPGHLEGNILRIDTTQPMEQIALLNRLGIHFLNLKIETANLEDVFLNLTGRRLRDE